jgi:F1F0 ATPase subunit 2
MSDAGSWVAALLAGAILGAIFFGGLWWTVQRGAASPAPVRWFLASLILRTAVVLGGFYIVGAGQPMRLGLCLLGFVLARAIVLRRTRPAPAAAPPPASGAPPCA